MQIRKELIGKSTTGSSCLQYYIYYDGESYGVEVEQVKTQLASGTVSDSRGQAVHLAQSLLRNQVFPDNLTEILDDYHFLD
ncbi:MULTISPECIES: DUF6514 family protein [Caproicibacterium]|jgi:hypothetical protein|uniref:Uncharacterized protein n=1 Tax=Caproicibacterium lactatifermentans TaxID=2666138 RepID=A0A859DSD3_9FIRM|nr:DUF6514 family protein [Caproicibacterium lactatifermentans]ARP49680.1 hypothetical protein B6259_01470 [Ruminococcaceae bacterium CPB6]MDD4807757.1 DUF6514 family protein [Oscillospiraceae bacterium]QKN24584.1 hypothetical protein GJQ69_08940 [Caproicibacterium lactatifermentans]QKO30205.1 hypothetical protein GKP14_03770 [Caproicibacterium lactatifermentans]